VGVLRIAPPHWGCNFVLGVLFGIWGGAGGVAAAGGRKIPNFSSKNGNIMCRIFSKINRFLPPCSFAVRNPTPYSFGDRNPTPYSFSLQKPKNFRGTFGAA